MGTAFSAIYRTVCDMKGAYPSVKNVVKLLNLPTEMDTRMRINRMALRKTAEERLESVSTGQLTMEIDSLPINFRVAELFCFPGTPESIRVTLNFKGAAEFAQ